MKLNRLATNFVPCTKHALYGTDIQSSYYESTGHYQLLETFNSTISGSIGIDNLPPNSYSNSEVWCGWLAPNYLPDDGHACPYSACVPW